MVVLNCFIYFFPLELLTIQLTLKLFKVEVPWKSIIWLPLLHSLGFYFIHFAAIPLWLKIILSISLGILLGIIFFRQDYITSIFLILSAYFILIPIEQIWMGFKVGVSDEHYFGVFSSLDATISNGLPLILVMGFLYLFVRYLKFSFTEVCLNEIFLRNKSFKYISLVLSLYIQSIVMIYLIYFFVSKEGTHSRALYFVLIAVFLFAMMLWLMRRIFNLIRDERDLAMAQEQIKSLSQLNFTLKSQKHDFHNHLQLITSLTQLGRPEQVLSYIKEITGEVNLENKGYNSGIPPLDGLLEYKMSLAKKYNIELNIEIQSPLSNLPLTNLQLCRVVGNLLNNAIEYLQEKEGVQRYIRFCIEDDDHEFRLVVVNPVAEEKIFAEGVEHLLQPGHTSKGDGHGLGLAIVNELLQKVGGIVKPELDERRSLLAFHVHLPKSSVLFGEIG